MITQKISLGMVNYNSHPDLLRLSIKSAFAYTLNLEELIVVDNGSTNGNIDLLYELAKEFKKIRIIRRQQKGLGASIGKGEGCNVLIKEFKTEYAAFYENDGFLVEKGWDKMLIRRLIERDLDMIGNGYPLVEAQNRVISEAFTTFSVFKVSVLQNMDINFLPDGQGPSFLSGFDTGCQLAKHFSDERAECLVFKSGRRNETKYFRWPGFAEYYFEEKFIFAHFGRGSGHSIKLSSNFFGKLIGLAKHFHGFLFKSRKSTIGGNAFSYFESRNKLENWVKASNRLLKRKI